MLAENFYNPWREACLWIGVSVCSMLVYDFLVYILNLVLHDQKNIHSGLDSLSQDIRQCLMLFQQRVRPNNCR